MRYYNASVRSAFTEYDNIDNILDSRYVLQKLYVVEQQDGSFKYYDEDLTEIKSSSSYLNIPEKAYTAFWDKDFVNKYISSNAKLENIYYISGEINQMGTAIYYKTSVGDYVYYNYYSIGEKLFPIEDFCKYQKAISDELAKHSDENGSEDIDISDFMDLAKYELKKVATSSENIKGDANCDGQVDLSDAVMIMQALANPNKYGIDGTAERHLTEQGQINGDIDGDGITVGDAQAIQMKLLGLDKVDHQNDKTDVVEQKPLITVEDILNLSKKDEELTWSDFEKYKYTDVGSGLYIWEFEVDKCRDTKLKIGGGNLEEKPDYIKLTMWTGVDVDVRNDDLTPWFYDN